MRFKFDHDYHIHSQLSTCSNDPEQTPQRILQYAKDNKLSRICLTDHYWDSSIPGASRWYKPQNFEHIKTAAPLPVSTDVDFLFGCETDMDRFMTLGIPSSRFDDFDFIIIPTTHLHMIGFTINEKDKDSNETRAILWIQRLDKLFDMTLPFHKIGIAHLACPLINKKSREDYLETLELIPDKEMERIFSKAAKAGCGIELNQCDMNFSDNEKEKILRMFQIAKNCGCKFYLGSDAHHPANFKDTKDIFERAITLLSLTEADKFHIQ